MCPKASAVLIRLFLEVPHWPWLRMLRIWKLERYVMGFSFFDDILRQNATVFVMTGVVAANLWVLCSALMSRRTAARVEVKHAFQGRLQCAKLRNTSTASQ